MYAKFIVELLAVLDGSPNFAWLKTFSHNADTCKSSPDGK